MPVKKDTYEQKTEYRSQLIGIKKRFMDIWREQQPTPCQRINLNGVDVVVKRDDLNHKIVQGNKLRKLKHNFIWAANHNHDHILTYGGAYSNHLLATAFAAKECGFSVTGVVRGDELVHNRAVWSETLLACEKLGMELVFVSRPDYRLKEKGAKVQEIIHNNNQMFVIPEGGSNALAIQGMADMVGELALQTDPPSHLICPVGTGGTLAGIIQGAAQQEWRCKVFGVSVLKSLHSVKDNIYQWLGETKNCSEWQIIDDFHCGGYAKMTPELIRFGVSFGQQHGMFLDKVYNSKAFFALAQMIESGVIQATDSPLIINTGGQQGGVLKVI